MLLKKINFPISLKLLNMQDGINVLSLFDGKSCGQIAFERLGIKVNNYFASEVDKYAMQITQKNYPDTWQLGDVQLLDVSKLPKIDIVIGGSPCQGFSFAGKMKGMATTCEREIVSLDEYLKLKSEGFKFNGQSYLFWEYVRVLRDIQKVNPDVKFFLENVRMLAKWKAIINEQLGVEPLKDSNGKDGWNSALLSAQNRFRLYWTNVTPAKPPKDKGILLRDILETEVDEKYFLSDECLARIAIETPRIDPDKSYAVLQKNNSSATSGKRSNTFISVLNDKGTIRRNANGKANCVDANYAKGMDNHAQRTLIQCVAMRGRPDGDKNSQQLEPRHDDDKTNALTSVQKDNLVIQLNPSKESHGQQPFQQNRVYGINGQSPALDTRSNQKNILVPEATKQGYVEIEPGGGGYLTLKI